MVVVIYLAAAVLVFSSICTEAKLSRVCYYSNWAQYRPGNMKFFPESIDATLCDYYIYAFAKLEGNHLTPYEWNDESTDWSMGMYERFNNLKNSYPAMKTLLAVGGWNHGTATMTAMLSTPENRHEFVMSTIDYLRTRNFDGFDLDFEYPGNRGSPPEDKYRFTELVKELRVEFDREGIQTGQEPLLLSAGVAAGKETIDTAYEVDKICKDLDFINLMSYDLNGAWDSYTGMNSPLFPRKEETGRNATLNQVYGLNYWIDNGCPKEKMMMGLATYGRAFTLTSKEKHCVRCPASGAAPPGEFTREAGFYSYYEACRLLNEPGTVRVWDEQHNNPYLYTASGVWLGYDDPQSIEVKVNYLKENHIGGYMFWNLDLDDFTGELCGQGKYPLMTKAKETANGDAPPPPVTNSPPVVTTTVKPPKTEKPEAPKETEAPKPSVTQPSTTTPSPVKDDCSDVSDGLYPHPSTCLKYIICNHGSPIVQECFHNTLYHASQQICDWPNNMSAEELKRCEGEY